MSEPEISAPDHVAPPELAPALLPEAAAPAAYHRRPAAWALVLMALVSALAIAVLGYVAWDDSRTHQQTAREVQRADGLASQLSVLRDEQKQLGLQLTALQGDNARLQGQARNPTLAMWNSCAGPCSIAPNSVRVGSVPDTFQLQINFTADVPVRTYIFTFHQWTQFDGCGFNIRCVTGSYTAFDPATSFSQTVDQAEGCSGYVWVLQTDREGTIKPDVKVHYLPASHPTGVCASSP